MGGKTYKKGGKNRKSCPRCKVFVDDDLAACPACHLLFEEEDNEPIVLPVAAKRPNQGWCQTISMGTTRIPAGANPIRLRGKDKEALLHWANAVRQYWLNKNTWLLKEGLCYYLMWETYFEYKPRLYDAACKIINENLSDEMP